MSTKHLLLFDLNGTLDSMNDPRATINALKEEVIKQGKEPVVFIFTSGECNEVQGFLGNKKMQLGDGSIDGYSCIENPGEPIHIHYGDKTHDLAKKFSRSDSLNLIHEIVALINKEAGKEVLGDTDWTAIDDKGSRAVITKAFPMTPQHHLIAEHLSFIEPRVIDYDHCDYMRTWTKSTTITHTQILRDRLAKQLKPEQSEATTTTPREFPSQTAKLGQTGLTIVVGNVLGGFAG